MLLLCSWFHIERKALIYSSNIPFCLYFRCVSFYGGVTGGGYIAAETVRKLKGNLSSVAPSILARFRLQFRYFWVYVTYTTTRVRTRCECPWISNLKFKALHVKVLEVTSFNWNVLEICCSFQPSRNPKWLMRQLQNIIGRSEATQMSITVLIISGMESLKMRITHLKGMNEGILVQKA